MSGVPSEPNLLVPQREDLDRVVRFETAPWLMELRRIEVSGATGTRRNQTCESLCVVLSGTHDLFAGGGTWTRRGLRPTPFDGRPVAVYLPPNTPFGCTDGAGALLVVSVRQPAITTPVLAREQLARKPLLPLLGSGKAYDPSTGEWKPREAFADSPEALLPRRIEARETATGARYERILPFDYKTRGLCVDEAALSLGVPLRFEPPSTAGYPGECALWLELEGVLDCEGGPDGVAWRLETTTDPRVLHCAADAIPTLTLREGRAYALAVYAGDKSA